MHFAVREGTAWTFETVPFPIPPPRTNTIIDTTGTPATGYSDGLTLRYLYKSGGTWTTESIGGFGPNASALAANEAGRPFEIVDTVIAVNDRIKARAIERVHQAIGKDLKGKVGIITGAARGIGKATATLLAQHGAKVVIADINEKMAEATADSLRTQSYQALAVTTDVFEAGFNRRYG